MQISKRLQRVAAQVQSGGVVADIGCDHGFTSIYLIENHLAKHVIAMDINEGPLERAKEHIKQFQMEETISIRLSDGAKELSPGEVDSILISGMGGGLICKILQDSKDVIMSAEELILSPQSENYLVRQLLHEMGFFIEREEMLVDQGKYYNIIHAVKGKQHFLSPEEYIYGKYLIEHKDTVLFTFLEKEQKRVKAILKGMGGKKLSEGSARQKKELEEQLKLMEKTKSLIS